MEGQAGPARLWRTLQDVMPVTKERQKASALLNWIKSSTNPDAIRGREQHLIEHYRARGIAADQYNGVRANNPNRQRYLDAATRLFGKPWGAQWALNRFCLSSDNQLKGGPIRLNVRSRL